MTTPAAALALILSLTDLSCSPRRRLLPATPPRSSSRAFAPAPGSTRSRRWCGGSTAEPLRCDQAKEDRRVTRVPRHAVRPRARRRGEPLGVGHRQRRERDHAFRPVVARISSTGGGSAIEQRYGRVDAKVQGSQWMMQWVRQRPDAPAHLADRAR